MKDILSEKRILYYLGKTDIKYRPHIYDNVPSTNEMAKKMIYTGEAAAGSIIIAISDEADLEEASLHQSAESISVLSLLESRYYIKKHFCYLPHALPCI